MRDSIVDINGFFRTHGIVIDPLPHLILDDSIYEDTIDIKTGSYCPETYTIKLSTHNRIKKDILRSYCHELIHHTQNLTNHKLLLSLHNKSIIDDVCL